MQAQAPPPMWLLSLLHNCLGATPPALLLTEMEAHLEHEGLAGEPAVAQGVHDCLLTRLDQWLLLSPPPAPSHPHSPLESSQLTLTLPGESRDITICKRKDFFF